MRTLFTLFLANIALACGSNENSCCDKSQTEEKETSGKRTFRLIFPERPNSAPKSAYIFDGENNHRINLPSMNFSRVIELPKGELTLIMAPNEIETRESLPQGAPQVTLGKHVTDFYILLSPDPDNPTIPVKLELIDLDERNLGPGNTLWMNLTSHRIFATLGNSESWIAPEGETLAEAPIAQSGYYKAKFQQEQSSGTELQPISAQQWWHDANSRYLGFIVDSGGRLPKIFFYRDFRQP